MSLECIDYCLRTRHKAVHHPCVKKITVNYAVLYNSLGNRIIKNFIKYRFQFHILIFDSVILVIVKFQAVKNKIGCVYLLFLRHKACFKAVCHKFLNRRINHHILLFGVSVRMCAVPLPCRRNYLFKVGMLRLPSENCLSLLA